MKTTKQLAQEVQTELLTEIEEQAKDVIESFLSTVKAREKELKKAQKNLAKDQNDYNELLALTPEEIVEKHRRREEGNNLVDGAKIGNWGIPISRVYLDNDTSIEVDVGTVSCSPDGTVTITGFVPQESEE